eukprot:TRINITY_DN6929_c0_g1_i3.p2 TRINITY_DN6929_c0_g1~~TRINITY_DN6929_c0_g1_i3.p2  ORF type:complete len:134 (-),score=22.62 TRINITY_DN6929_c0_g1_i3:143-544(-)
MNIVSRPSSRKDNANHKPAHHSAPFACDLTMHPSSRRQQRAPSVASQRENNPSRPSTACSMSSCATGYSSHRCSSRASRASSRATSAGLGSDHMVIKKMADLEAKVARERQARLDMEDEMSVLREQLQQTANA